MLTLPFSASSPFFIFLSAVATSHATIGSYFSGYVCIVIAWSLSYNYENNYSIRVMILSCSWIYLHVRSKMLSSCFPLDYMTFMYF